MHRNYFINGKVNDNGEVEIEGAVRRGVPKETAAAFRPNVRFRPNMRSTKATPRLTLTYPIRRLIASVIIPWSILRQC